MNALTRQPATNTPYLDELLDCFALEMRYIPTDAKPVTDLRDLPFALELRAIACGVDAAWRAWTDGRSIWFITGRLSRWFIQNHNRPMLQALFFDPSGQLVSSGIWRRDKPGSWTLCVA